MFKINPFLPLEYCQRIRNHMTLKIKVKVIIHKWPLKTTVWTISPREDAGGSVENTSSVSPACRKRRLKGRRYIAIVADTA